MNSPDISVGMPVYNGERFLSEALQSLLRQSHASFELIVSDNASSDATETICRDYAARDPRIRYFRQPENIGASGNFSFVLKAAKAEFFTWAACDDLWDPDWLSKLVDAIRDRKGAFAFGRLSVIGASGASIGHAAAGRSFEFGGARGWLRQWRFYLDPEPLGKANLIYGLFRREEIDETALQALQHSFGDVVFIFRQLAALRLIQVSGAAIHKRIHEGGAARQESRPATTSLARFARMASAAFLELPRRYASNARGLLASMVLAASPLKGVLFLAGLMRSRRAYRET